MDIQNTQTTYHSEKKQSSSADRKLYPLTMEQMDQEYDWAISVLEKVKAERETKEKQQKAE